MATLDLVRLFPQAEIVHRPFDDFAAQCNFGLSKINSEWVLSLDADYELSSAPCKRDQDPSARVLRFRLSGAFHLQSNGPSTKGDAISAAHGALSKGASPIPQRRPWPSRIDRRKNAIPCWKNLS